MKRSFLYLGLLSAFLGLLPIFPSASQADTEDIRLGESSKLFSKVLQEEREIWIYLPDEYATSGDSYPVLYLLDGSNHFNHVSGMVHFYAQRGVWPQLLVVAVLNKTQETRSRDFTPVPVESRPDSGGADIFLKFMLEELFPQVETRYRTQPYRILMGHSLAGLFAIHTLLNETALFDAYITTSPWLGYHDNHLISEAEAVLSKNKPLHRFLYMTAGNEPRLVASIESFTRLLEKYASSGLNWSYVHVQEEVHGTIPHRGFWDGLRKLYAPWRMPAEVYQVGIEAVMKHYRILSDIYGYPLQPSFVDLYFMGVWFLQRRQADKAVGVLEETVKLYPKNWAGYSSLGEAYLLGNDRELAKVNYRKALELNPQFTKGKEILERLEKK